MVVDGGGSWWGTGAAGSSVEFPVRRGQVSAYMEHWNNEKGCMVNVSQGDDVFGSNLGYNRLILVNAC